MRLQSGDRSSALVRYLTDIRGGTVLTREEEADLARRARIGNRDAMNRLVEANLGFVVRVAGECALGRPPEREELARSLVLGTARLEHELLLDSRTRSLDQPASRKSDVPLREALPDTDATSGEEGLLRREAIELVTRALECLDPQERRVLEYRYGLNKEQSLVLREVGRSMGVSRERVRQIEVRALRRLRRRLAPRVRAGASAVVGGPPFPPAIRTLHAGARIALETRSSPG